MSGTLVKLYFFHLRNPVVCGITSLGLDHCAILGYKIEEIAEQKAGILKPSCIGFTVKQETDSALNVIVQKAKELNVKFSIFKCFTKCYKSINIYI